MDRALAELQGTPYPKPKKEKMEPTPYALPYPIGTSVKFSPLTGMAFEDDNLSKPLRNEFYTGQVQNGVVHSAYPNMGEGWFIARVLDNGGGEPSKSRNLYFGVHKKSVITEPTDPRLPEPRVSRRKKKVEQEPPTHPPVEEKKEEPDKDWNSYRIQCNFVVATGPRVYVLKAAAKDGRKCYVRFAVNGGVISVLSKRLATRFDSALWARSCITFVPGSKVVRLLNKAEKEAEAAYGKGPTTYHFDKGEMKEEGPAKEKTS
jgi:hypothetical protein